MQRNQNEQLLFVDGRFCVKNGVRVVLHHDFAKFYKKLIEMQRGYILQLPKYQPHVTIVSPKIHADYPHSFERQIRPMLHMKPVRLKYSPNIQIGGSQKRGFYNFYLQVFNQYFDSLKRFFNVKDRGRFLGYHVTVANTKNLNK